MGNAITCTTLFFLLFTPLVAPGYDSEENRAESTPTAILKEYASINPRIIPESSGIVKSRKYPDLYWVHSDSGNRPSVYPIHSDGTQVLRRDGGGFSSAGIELMRQENVDWEDITADDRGNLIIADSGNNRFSRGDLAVLCFPEPDPYHTSAITEITRVRFRYPESKPVKTHSYDSEAIFWSKGSLYLLTKQLAGCSRLYRFPSLEPGTEHTLIFLGQIHTEGMVTAADADDSRNELAILTYSGIIIFKRETGTEDFVMQSHLRIAAGQCEGISYSGESLLITNERGEIFRVPLDDLTQ